MDSIDSKADTIVTLYGRCDSNAQVQEERDDAPSDSYELIYWTPPLNGYYCLKIMPFDEGSIHADIHNGYTVTVFPSNAPEGASIEGTVKNEAGVPIEGARIYSSANHSTTSNE